MNVDAIQLRRARAAIYGPPLMAVIGLVFVAAGVAGLSDRSTTEFPGIARIETDTPTPRDGPHVGAPPVAPPAATAPKGYVVVSAGGKLKPGGKAIIPAGATIVGATRAPARGYWLATDDGRVVGVGVPSAGNQALARTDARIVGIAASPEAGYWLASSDGNVYAIGAIDLGNIFGISADNPVVGIAASPSGGFWLAQADGTVSAFGAPDRDDAQGKTKSPVVGIAASPIGGYWLVTRNGHVFAFGAKDLGGTADMGITSPVVAFAADSTGGYSIATDDGGVYQFGKAVAAQRVGPNFGKIAALVPR
jgi:ligand-binding sensor domain-containing protein